MNSSVAIEEIIGWDIPNWSTALDYWITHTQQPIKSIQALEIGTADGGISLWAALQGMNVLCTDLDSVSDKAVQKHHRHGLADRIKYAAVDAMNIPYTAKFDVVLFKSVLGGVGGIGGVMTKENQVKTIQEIYRSLKPGGELWFAENLVASPLHQFFRNQFRRNKYKAWGMDWRYITIPEMHEFLADFSDISYTTTGLMGCFGRTPWQWSLLGNLDQAIAARMVPESWRYITIGVARK
jgi:SAM-dependent methyltransferase